MERKKRCYKCKIYKPLTSFNRDKSRKDGREFICRICRKEKDKKYQLNNKDKIKQYKKRWRENNRDKIRKSFKKYYYENWERYALKRKQRYLYLKKYHPEVLKIYHYNVYNSPKGQYNIYKKNAIKRNLPFEISLKEFSKYWGKDCFYCGAKIKKIGLDRIDNTKGYVKNNIVPCCELCNWMKRDLNQNDFIKHCCKIIENHPLPDPEDVFIEMSEEIEKQI